MGQMTYTPDTPAEKALGPFTDILIHENRNTDNRDSMGVTQTIGVGSVAKFSGRSGGDTWKPMTIYFTKATPDLALARARQWESVNQSSGSLSYTKSATVVNTRVALSGVERVPVGKVSFLMRLTFEEVAVLS